LGLRFHDPGPGDNRSGQVPARLLPRLKRLPEEKEGLRPSFF
jgi:hypothetical protein